ncbi:hypothetical protein C2845_PM05G29160 [Panicum miliaceum]|uniref:F-box domain-containing protein n=1 Tax=Panicum miliaceum TaxID=4540 RepID=A0A3L6SY34_PANMI|nr:hypothetical protein C2845_PM05G29160 [Panicum miliaceum]
MEVSSCSIHALCDDTLAEILVCLDAVSVLRCRAVCTRWRGIATARSFLAARLPRGIIVRNEHGFTRCSLPPSPDPNVMMTGDGHRYLFDPSPRAADGTLGESCFELCASFDGLLVLEYRQGRFCDTRSPGTYIVCNPVTRQWTLPSLRSPATVSGFYFHASSGEHRLLFRCEITPGGEDYDVCIVSVGSGAPPRRLTRGPLRHGPDYGFPPPGPDEQARVSAVVAHLLELEGDLCVAAMQDYVTLNIWALQDYGAAENRWTLRHRVNVQRPPWMNLKCHVGIIVPIMALSVWERRHPHRIPLR